MYALPASLPPSGEVLYCTFTLRITSPQTIHMLVSHSKELGTTAADALSIPRGASQNVESSFPSLNSETFASLFFFSHLEVRATRTRLTDCPIRIPSFPCVDNKYR